MKNLILLRHGDASYGLDDFNRDLTELGERQVKEAAKKIISKNISIDLILHSSSLRTAKTANIVADEISISNDKALPNSELYNASVDEIISVLREQHKDFNTILLVGHNPGISEICGKLNGSKFTNLETGEIVFIDLDIDSWNSI